MAKKTTLGDLAVQMAAGFAKQGKDIHDLTDTVSVVVKHMATKEDIADIKQTVASKEQIISLHTQVNSIET